MSSIARWLLRAIVEPRAQRGVAPAIASVTPPTRRKPAGLVAGGLVESGSLYTTVSKHCILA